MSAEDEICIRVLESDGPLPQKKGTTVLTQTVRVQQSGSQHISTVTKTVLLQQTGPEQQLAAQVLQAAMPALMVIPGAGASGSSYTVKPLGDGGFKITQMLSPGALATGVLGLPPWLQQPQLVPQQQLQQVTSKAMSQSPVQLLSMPAAQPAYASQMAAPWHPAAPAPALVYASSMAKAPATPSSASKPAPMPQTVIKPTTAATPFSPANQPTIHIPSSTLDPSSSDPATTALPTSAPESAVVAAAPADAAVPAAASSSAEPELAPSALDQQQEPEERGQHIASDSPATAAAADLTPPFPTGALSQPAPALASDTEAFALPPPPAPENPAAEAGLTPPTAPENPAAAAAAALSALMERMKRTKAQLATPEPSSPPPQPAAAATSNEPASGKGERQAHNENEAGALPLLPHPPAMPHPPPGHAAAPAPRRSASGSAGSAVQHSSRAPSEAHGDTPAAEPLASSASAATAGREAASTAQAPAAAAASGADAEDSSLPVTLALPPKDALGQLRKPKSHASVELQVTSPAAVLLPAGSPEPELQAEDSDQRVTLALPPDNWALKSSTASEPTSLAFASPALATAAAPSSVSERIAGVELQLPPAHHSHRPSDAGSEVPSECLTPGACELPSDTSESTTPRGWLELGASGGARTYHRSSSGGSLMLAMPPLFPMSQLPEHSCVDLGEATANSLGIPTFPAPGQQTHPSRNGPGGVSMDGSEGEAGGSVFQLSMPPGFMTPNP